MFFTGMIVLSILWYSSSYSFFNLFYRCCKDLDFPTVTGELKNIVFLALKMHFSWKFVDKLDNLVKTAIRLINYIQIRDSIKLENLIIRPMGFKTSRMDFYSVSHVYLFFYIFSGLLKAFGLLEASSTKSVLVGIIILCIALGFLAASAADLYLLAKVNFYSVLFFCVVVESSKITCTFGLQPYDVLPLKYDTKYYQLT